MIKGDDNKLDQLDIATLWFELIVKALNVAYIILVISGDCPRSDFSKLTKELAFNSNADGHQVNLLTQI